MSGELIVTGLTEDSGDTVLPDPPPPNPGLTRTDIIEEIRARLGEAAEDWWKDDQVIRAVNQAQQKFAHEQRWSWLMTEVTGVTLTSGSAQLLMTPDIDINRQFDVMLTPSSQRPYFPHRVTPTDGFRMRGQYWNSTGSCPQWFYLAKARMSSTDTMQYVMQFVPGADQDYTVEYLYFRNPADLGHGAAVPDCPTSYVECIIAWATGKLWLNELNSSTKAQEQFNIYNAVLHDAIRDEKSMAQDAPLTRGGSPPAWPDTWRGTLWWQMGRQDVPLGP